MKQLTVIVIALLMMSSFLMASDSELQNNQKSKELIYRSVPADVAKGQNAGLKGTEGEAVLFFEDFEALVGLGGWFTDGGYSSSTAGIAGVTTEKSHWMVTTANSYSPSASMMIDDNFDVYRDLLVSPAITLPTDISGDPLVSAKLSFWIDIDNPGYLQLGTNYLADYYQVYVGSEETAFHRTNVNPFAGTYSWYCGYDDGSGYPEANSWQFLTSPQIDLTAATGTVNLTFNHKIVTEDYWDLGVVSVSLDGFATVDADLAVYGESTANWQAATVNLSAYKGQKIHVRFRFLPDFGTSVPAGGWWIDDIMIKGGGGSVYLNDTAEDGAVAMIPFGVTFTQLFYDYDRSTTADVEWTLQDETVLFNGTADLFDFGLVPGDVCWLGFLYLTDGLTDQGEAASRGMFIDDITITGVSGVAVDAGIGNVWLGYPATFTQKTPAVVQVLNEGFDPQTGIGLWYKIDDGPGMPVPPYLAMAPFSDTLRNLNIMWPGTGEHTVTAWTTLANDANPENDEFTAEPVEVLPPGLAFLGYDDRTTIQYLTQTTFITWFTVLNELKGTSKYNVEEVSVLLYDAGGAEDAVDITIAEVSRDNPLDVIRVVWEGTETILVDDFSYHYFPLYGDPTGMNLAGDLVVMVDFANSNGSGAVLMDARTPFAGHNIYLNADDGNWYFSGYGRKVNALVSYIDQPEIMSVLDVPNDQGGKVLVSWGASLNDHMVHPNPVSMYTVWHKVDPELFDINTANIVTVPDMNGLYAYGPKAKENDVVLITSAEGVAPWRWVATLPSHPGWDAYSTFAETWKDSTVVDGLYLNYYMVTAYTVDGNFVDSEEAAGYSVDNLVPAAPIGLAALEYGGAIQLSWLASEDADFNYFAVYRNDMSEPLGFTTDVSFTDPNVQVGKSYTYQVTAFDFAGNEGEAAEVTLTITTVEGFGNAVPTEYALYNNYPNPFNPVTSIKYALPKAGHVTVKVLNIFGQEVATLVNGEKAAGYHTISWEAKDAGSGVYFYTMKAGDFKATQKMILTK